MKKLGKNLSTVKESVEAYYGCNRCTTTCYSNCDQYTTVHVYIFNSAYSSLGS